jgi:hypothetical protein
MNAGNVAGANVVPLPFIVQLINLNTAPCALIARRFVGIHGVSSAALRFSKIAESNGVMMWGLGE